MKNKLANKAFKTLLAIFVVLIPFQTRWIFYDWKLEGQIWEYGRISIYLSMAILLLAAIFFLLANKKEIYFSKDRYLYFLFIYSLFIGFISPVPAVSFYYLAIIYLAALFAYLIKFLPKYFVFKALLFSGSIQAAIAMWQLLSQQVVASKWLGVASHLPETLGTSVVEVGGERLLRAYGTLPHPNILGGFLLVALFAGVYLWLDFYKRMDKKGWHSAFKKKNIVEFFLIIFGLVLSSFGLLASFSRSALLALALSLFSLLLINTFRRKWLIVNVVAKYAVVFLLVAMCFNIIWPDSWGTRLRAEGRLEEQSISERVDTLDQLGWKDYQTAFLGQGLGMNTYKLYQAAPDNPIYNNQPIHDIFLLMLAEVGVIGVFLLFNVVRLIIKSANQVDIMSTSLILGLIVVGLFDHYLWTSWAGWLLAAIGLVNLYKHKD